jgi:hypothetical protein
MGIQTMDEFMAHLQELCDQIAATDVEPQALAESFGNVKEEVFQSIRVAPVYDEWFSEVVVNADPDGEKVTHVLFELVEALPLAALEAAFGEYRRQRGVSKSPAKAVFGVQAKSDTHTATLFAAMEGKNTRRITIRRDRRLS